MAPEGVRPELQKDAVGKIVRVEELGVLSISQGSTAQEDSANTALVRTNLHFADNVLQHFKQPERSLHPASAWQMLHRQRSSQSTDETSWGITIYI